MTRSERGGPVKKCWYENGLDFACTQCGHCCKVEGFVWVDRSEIEAIAAHLGLSVDEFGRRYLRRVHRRYSLLEKPNLECVFWDDGCRIYSVRPTQCRTFPFWPDHLKSFAAWDDLSEECPGIGGPRHYTRTEIDELRRGRGQTRATRGSDGDDRGARSKP
ncbi:MAG: YkgJ family cysteine cluster protein [Planctomycetes bacterium]|nr:YkgJ family cysteine cluster protein [Planctomycetota bacterium]